MKHESLQSLWYRAKPFALPACLCLFAALCLTGLNPYFRPDYHDNITYFVAAESLLSGNGYTFQGAPIADWPPVTSLMLAGVFAISGPSIFIAKLTSLIAAIISILLAHRLLRNEQRADRLKTIVLFSLTPVALLTATTVASDWICAALSFGCLLALGRMREHRTVSLAVATGLLLGLASLTRQTGVLLGAAIIAQAFLVIRGGNRLRTTWPELVAAAIGATMYLSWGFYTAAQIAEHPPLTGNYANQGLALFTDFSFTELALSIFDLFWKWDDVLAKAGVPTWFATTLLIIPSGILIVGAITTLRSGRAHPSDYYALAFIALIFGYHWKMGRYLLPIAPFLISWFFTGLRSISAAMATRGWLARPSPERLVATIAATWLALLIPLNAYVLFNRTGNGAHRGISMLRNPLPSDYYQGHWADLHAACEAIKQDGRPGAVAGDGFYLRYIHVFSDRLASDIKREPEVPADYVLFVAEEDSPLSTVFANGGHEKIFHSDHVTVFRRIESPSTQLSARQDPPDFP